MTMPTTIEVGCAVNNCSVFTLLVCAYKRCQTKGRLRAKVYDPGEACKVDDECTAYPYSTCIPDGLCAIDAYEKRTVDNCLNKD
ncbi:unnamed protein product [Gongylonema pulchrum]|uniref:EB domain-containing protein n=1 Tax=Gongylonema pulchrum TaxID=637853 RepID=A0A183ETC8_9BILA|nr:unnamed protein product [Gongylonema pulchrum]